MATTRYKIIYRGQLKPGVRAQQAITGFVSRFQISEVQARHLILGGRETVLKKDVDAETAETFRITLDAVGLEVHVEPMTPPPPADLELAPEEPPGSGDIPDQGLGTAPPASSDDRSANAPAVNGTSSTIPRPSAPLASSPGRGNAPGPETPPAERLTGPYERSLGAGGSWIAKGFWHFKTDLWPWIGAIVILYVITIAVGLVPIVGALATTILGPIFTGGLMIGAQAQDRGEAFRVEHLFAGFSQQAGQLALIGVIYLVGGLLIGLLIGVWVSGSIAVGLSGMDPPDLGTPDAEQLLPLIAPAILLPTLFAFLLAIPLGMALFLAPPLVALDGLTAIAAMKLSFIGCLKNILPLLVFGLLAALMVFVGLLPFLLGMLIVSPLLLASIYAAYRDIFFSGRGT